MSDTRICRRRPPPALRWTVPKFRKGDTWHLIHIKFLCHKLCYTQCATIWEFTFRFHLLQKGFLVLLLPFYVFYSCFFGLFAAVANCQPIWAYLWPVARGHPVAAVGGESLQLLLTEIYSSVCFLFRVKMSNGKYGLGAIERRFKTPAKRWQNCQLP